MLRAFRLLKLKRQVNHQPSISQRQHRGVSDKDADNHANVGAGQAGRGLGDGREYEREAAVRGDVVGAGATRPYHRPMAPRVLKVW